MLNLLAVFLVCSGIGIAVHIAIDLTHRPQSMKIMNAVWILTALWGSYLALWAYNKFGQGAPMEMGGGERDEYVRYERYDYGYVDGRYVHEPSSLAVCGFIGFTLWSRLHIG